MKINLPSKLIPLALFTTTLLAHGLLLPFLGLYVDDWHHIYFGYTRGFAGLWDLFLYDGRPFAAFLYSIGFSMLGFSPLHWQVFTLLLRAFTVVVTWLYLKDIWPEHKRAVTAAALLFAVYPLFKQQFLAVAYSLHWFAFLLYSISIWAMVQSLLKPHRFWPFTLFSLITAALHLLLIEYFSGIELVRPIILFLLLSISGQRVLTRLRRTFVLWSPYLLLLVGFFIYRIALIPRPEPGFERNAPTLIYDFIAAPLSTAVRFVQIVLQETTAILYSAWENVLSPQLFTITQPPNLAALLIILLSGGALFFYLKNTQFESESNPQPARSWYRPALLAGVWLTVLGALPAWVTNQFITVDNPLWSDRYGLPSMLGASLVVIALLEALVASRDARLVILSLLVGLSIGWHFLTANDYRRSWLKQTDFYWQLYWRAPFIEPGTALLSDGEVLSHMTELSTSFALSTLYPKLNDELPQDYWFFNIKRRFDENREELIEGTPLRYRRNFYIFSGHSHDSLVIFYEPQNYECLWVVRPEDTDLRALPELTRDVAVISDLDRIRADSPSAQPISTEIFGKERQRTWCYYYQKADLSRQLEDWDQIVALWRQASRNGFAPGNGVEYLPFIEGFAHTAEWEIAEEMTFIANQNARIMPPILCPTWQKIERDTPPSPARDQTIDHIYNQLCASSP